MEVVHLTGGLGPLVSALRADGYRVIGPTVRGQAIVLGELSSADALPYGWGVSLSPGGYRLRRRANRAAFGHAAGPQSWKAFLHPAREQLLELKRDTDGGFTTVEPPVEQIRYAFLGVRPCDLRAIEVQDRVLGRGAVPDGRYAARRSAALLIAVNCTEPRSLPAADLSSLLAGAYGAAHWDEVAKRCLACGNCTMVCPACFCTTVSDTTDLTTDVARRWRRWDSCFDISFSYLHGGPVRTSARSRYRQWLNHKFGTWHDQFGESGVSGVAGASCGARWASTSPRSCTHSSRR